MIQGQLYTTVIRAFDEQRLAGTRAHGVSNGVRVKLPSPRYHDGGKESLYNASIFAGFYAHQIVLSRDATFVRPRAECQETA